MQDGGNVNPGRRSRSTLENWNTGWAIYRKFVWKDDSWQMQEPSLGRQLKKWSQAKKLFPSGGILGTLTSE